MIPHPPHRLLIYRRDAKAYQETIAPRLPQLEVHAASRMEEAQDVIERVDILLSSPWQFREELLDMAARLAWFASSSAGVEALVNNPHLPENVILTKGTSHGEKMAEYVFSYLLYFNKHIGDHLENQKKKVWDRSFVLRSPGRLRGQTMAILGLGSVGREIAKHGKQFGMNVVGLKRISGPIENVDRVFGPEGLKEMISLADYLVVILPLTPTTHHVLGEGELQMMKEGATLINIGRGDEIDEKALTRVLKTKKIRAVLDVFETEPLPRESELWGMENVFITPHISGADIAKEICEEFIANYERWVRGEPLVGLVDRRRGY